MNILDVVLHVDKFIPEWINAYGNWIYAILFTIIFIETGVVFMPFLPGDSLLFVIGSLTGSGHINFWFITLLLSVAAIAGDSLNYWIGNKFGDKIAKKYLKPQDLEKTKEFFEKYGPKTIIIARFIPIVRTLAPFTAGASNMNYTTFFKYNIVGGLIWVYSLVGLGHLLGSLTFVKENFEKAIYFVIIISLFPAIFEFIKSRRVKKNGLINDKIEAKKAVQELEEIKQNPELKE